MKYCSHCGKQMMDAAVICVSCGCPIEGYRHSDMSKGNHDTTALMQTLSARVKTSGIIWLVIGIMQILGGLYFSWVLLIVGALNIISAIKDLKYSKEVVAYPTGIVEAYTPLAGPIVTLIYNLVFGGVIGVAGSIYYFVGIRAFVMENAAAFRHCEAAQKEKTSIIVPKTSVAPGSWTCSCGRSNAPYVSTCTCGKTKREIVR